MKYTKIVGKMEQSYVSLKEKYPCSLPYEEIRDGTRKVGTRAITGEILWEIKGYE